MRNYICLELCGPTHWIDNSVKIIASNNKLLLAYHSYPSSKCMNATIAT